MLSKFHSGILAAGLAFIAWPAVPVGAGPLRTPESANHRKTFEVAGRDFAGTAKTICVIEGKWADGQQFRYEAWDTCADMAMRRTSYAEFKDEESYGNEDDPNVTDIPEKSEVFEVSNGSSSVLLFRDGKGVMREIMISD